MVIFLFLYLYIELRLNSDSDLISSIDLSLIRSLPQHQQFSGSGSSHSNGVCAESACPPPQLLRNIFIPMETIRSSTLLFISESRCVCVCVRLIDNLHAPPAGQLEPITVYDQGGVHVSLHFARDSPPGHPDVAVVVVSTVNTSALDVRDFLFQAAVPKVTTSGWLFKIKCRRSSQYVV